MKRIIFILLITICFLMQCRNPENKNKEPLNININESVWVQYVAENCYNSITFSKIDSIEIYSCEIGEKYYGTYKISNDTIICNIMKGQFDYEFPENSRHRLKPYKMKLLYSESELTELNSQGLKYIKK